MNNETTGANAKILLLAAACLWLLGGCARDSIEARRHEHWLAYSALPEAQRDLVDQGRLRPGMSMDAVYIAWGKPAETAEFESAQGSVIAWRYHAPSSNRRPRWTYRETRRDSSPVLERHPPQDKTSSDTVNHLAAEIHFVKNKIVNWRTLSQPRY